MTLKQPNTKPHGGYSFFYEGPGGVVIQVNEGANGLGQLATQVRASMRANGVVLSPAENRQLEAVIEHQICLRQPDPLESCWSGGLGDDLHHKYIKPFLKRVVARSIKSENGLMKFIGAVATKVSGCSGCGGTTVYARNKRNLGRAGVLNKIAPA